MKDIRWAATLQACTTLVRGLTCLKSVMKIIVCKIPPEGGQSNIYPVLPLESDVEFFLTVIPLQLNPEQVHTSPRAFGLKDFNEQQGNFTQSCELTP